jgi:acyl dehydratase
MSLHVATPADLLGHVGDHLDPTEWLTVEQDRIDLFADATGDHQWIHVDPERAAAGPFGAPIAHGYLTLSMANNFLPELLTVEQFSMGVNVGLEKVRFPSPVKVGSRIRAAGEILSAEELKGGVQVVVQVTIQVESAPGSDEAAPKPAAVIDTVSRFFP